MLFVRKIIVVIFTVAIFSPSLGLADRHTPLFEEFDARPLSYEEKRFLQGVLSLQGYYNGLLDGAWGGGSQSAIERYTDENYQDIPYNIHMATLAAEFYESDEAERWETIFLEDIGLSLILPMRNLTLKRDSPGFRSWEYTSSELSISASRLWLSDMAGLHNEILQFGSSSRAPYTVRNAERWVTSLQYQNGTIAYLRSDLIGKKCSSILLMATEVEEHKLNYISASISTGRTIPFVFPDSGEIERMVELGQDWIQSRETSTSAQAAIEPRAESSGSSGRSTGTGFYVDESGSVLTNSHVVENCVILTVNEAQYVVHARSTEFDLAVLFPSTPIETLNVASFASRPAKLNADVTVVGYPLHGLLGGLNVTRGSVASLSGLRGDSLRMQISAPVQLGNSGGPVLDKSGSVIGVVVSKLDSLQVAETVGDIPQNINFAIRGEIAKLFLTSYSIEYSISNDTERVEPTNIAESASRFTVLVECN